MSRVIDCPCGHQLRAEDDAALLRAMRDHVDQIHPEMKDSDDELREKLAMEAYHEGAMTEKNALTLVRRVFREVWEKGDLAAADELFARDFINHDPASPEVPPGPAGVRENVTRYHSAFPDQRFTLLDTIVAGDRIVVRWGVEATHSGPFGGVPPTKKRVHTGGISVLRIENGKIAEDWANWDTLGLLQQIGAVTAAPALATR